MTNKSPARGQSLVELVIAMGIGTVVALAMATIFAFGIDQFNNLVEQNRAEESLLQAAFLLKDYLSQAVKIECSQGNTAANGIPAGYAGQNYALGAGPIPTTQSLMNDPSPPVGNGTTGFPRGIIDCNAYASSSRNLPPPGTPLPGNGVAPSSAAPHTWNQGTANPFALFIRDEGGTTIGSQGINGGIAGTNGGQSYYIPTGIYFQPPTKGTAAVPGVSGVLYFAQTPNPGNVINTGATVQWDHIVDIGVIGPSATAPGVAAPIQVNVTGGAGAIGNTLYTVNNLESLQIRIVARYIWNKHYGIIDYEPYYTVGGYANPAWAPYRDIEIAVPIAFRNSFLGVSATGTGSAERIYGGMYFFRFTAPPSSAFDF